MEIRYLTDREQRKLRMKNIFIRDIERCPFTSIASGYEQWNIEDEKRLARLSRARTDLANKVNSYLSHEDRTVRSMALFLNRFLEK